MRLDEINASSFRQSDSIERQTSPDCDRQPAPESRALVALSPNADGREIQAGYRSAAFLAHLIAIKDHHPQTRERRRTDPAEVLAAYRAAAALSQA